MGEAWMSLEDARREIDMDMDEELNDEIAELLVNIAEENQTRKILLRLDECKDLTDAKAKVRAVLPD